MIARILKSTIFALIVVEASTQDMIFEEEISFDEDRRLLMAPRSQSKEFSMNLTSLLFWTSRISFIEDVPSNVDDFQQDFMQHLSGFGTSTLVKLDSSVMETCEKCNFTTYQKSLKKLIALKQIIFVVYDTCESLNSSLYENKRWSAYKESPRSFFVIVITSDRVTNARCSSSNFKNNLKNVATDLFDGIWKYHKLLETIMYFPYVCGEEKILKFNPVILDRNQSVKYVSKEDMMKNSYALLHMYHNLKGYPLKAKIFGRVPTSVKNLSESILNTYLKKDIEHIGYVGGIDGFTLGNLAKYLNFTADVSEPADGIEYGYMMTNGTYMGTLGDVIYKRSDISFNGRFLKDYGAEGIEFTTPIYHDQFCVLVPKALRIPTWRNIFLGFSMTAWYAILLTATISGLLWWLMKVGSPDPEPGSRGKLGFCIHFMDVCLLIASQPIFLPTLGRERIFIAGCLVFNIIFSGVFQGYLNTAFSTTSHYPDINTLEALDESGLPIATSSRLNDIFGSGSLQKKIKPIKTAAIDEAAVNRDVSAVERRSDARLLIELKYLASDGEPLLHVVNECPRSYYLSYIVYRGYPFLPHINRFIQRISEGGLNEQWYDFTMYSIVLHHRSKQKISSESLKKLTFVDVQTAFFALAIGLMFSSIVFLCETINFYIDEKKKTLRKKTWTQVVRPEMFYVPTRLPKYEFTL